MIKSKKFSIFLLILMLAMSSILFVACGKPDYSKTYLSASQTYIELFKGEDEDLTVTIKNPANDMSSSLNYSISNPSVCDIELVSQYGMKSNFLITAKNGGTSIIDFISYDGGKSISIQINVKDYSSILQAGDNGLYVSESSSLAPTSYDFKFDDNATERNLKYHFYGINNVKGSLTLDDVTSGDTLINNFTEVELYTMDNKTYLIFKDEEGLYHTLGTSKLVAGTGNTTYTFISAIKTEIGYSFNDAVATKVEAGQKYTFITVYENAIADEVIFCERDFSIVVDIDKKNVSHEFGYKIQNIAYRNGVDLTSYKIDGSKEGIITLIPNYIAPITTNPMLVGEQANYLIAYVEIAVKNLNEFLNVKIETKDKSVASSIVLGSINEGDYTVYCVQLNCGTGIRSATSLDFNLYYEGFENSDDENVNYVYSIPVNIHIKPTKLLVNNIDLNTSSKVYKFYNNYAADTFGWQAFNFTVVPEGAEYDKLYIDLTNSDLQVRYKNVIYTSGELEIDNLYETVYIKGGNDASLTDYEKILPFKLDFSVVQPDTIESGLKFSIVKGPSPLAFQTPAFEKQIYVERFGGEILFSDIYTDAEFTSMTFAHVSGSEVVNFKYNAASPYIQDGNIYRLNLHIIPTANGNGTYSVALDNGEQIAINIEVGESLNSVSLTTKDENNVIRYMENFVVDDDASSLIYLYNANQKTSFDLTLIANESTRSDAIDEILPDIHSPFLSMTQRQEKNSFMIYVDDSGTLSLTFTIQGFTIKNFERSETSIEYEVTIVSFNYLDRLNVYKLSDGFGDYASKTSASYANVYSNTYDENARKIKLEVSLQNTEAYLFANPANGKYIDSTYNPEYLYIESDALIFKDDEEVDFMYFSSTQTNIYTVGSYGTFDTETLTFTAFSNLVNSGRLKLIAHVKQYGKTYSYTININIEIYEIVENVTLQSPVSEIEFSALEREASIIAFPTNKTATDGEIVALFVGGEIIDASSGDVYSMFVGNSIQYLVIDGKTQITLKVSDEFLKKSEEFNNWTDGDLIIVAKDWLDNGGNIRSEYQELALHIKITFANGTLNHRFTLKDAEDIVMMKDNLSAHYKISTTIDVSTIINQLPLGELKGSIIGVNDYAIITNINIKNPIEVKEGSLTRLYYGLFTRISSSAFIEYVQFEGSFSVDYTKSVSYLEGDRNIESNIGLLASENNGKLTNVGAKIKASNVNIQYGNFGGLVGLNNGEIIQDFTLFEDEDSNTRTYTKAELTTLGRVLYKNASPIIGVQMTDFVNVNYLIENSTPTFNPITRIGGLAGFNVGTIKKIDSNKKSFNGYSNYMSHILIKSQPSNLADIDQINNVFVGGLIGESGNETAAGIIIGGYNKVNETSSKAEFQEYASYANDSDTSFEAGEGLLVGGEIWGYGYVGGVAGRVTNLSSSIEFCGVTSRAFVRGQKAGNSPAKIAIIANIETVKNNATLTNAFAIQAVDDGKLSEEASMAILYNNENIASYTNDVNKLGFGNFANSIGSLKGFDGEVEEIGKPINVFTYVISRQMIETQEQPNGEYYIAISNANKSTYYGDFVIVGTKEGEKVVLAQKRFTKGEEVNLSISAKFNNKMTTSTSGAKDVFYAYYFQVSSVSEETIDIPTIQADLDINLNKIGMYGSLYPFIANGEMVFNSQTPNVLTIDQVGKITIKKDGLALISASSVLNSNNALSFYIYVINYFNSESLIANNDDRNSIVFNDSSASAIAVDKSNIELRGNNSAELFVRPRYDLDLNLEANKRFLSDRFGKSRFQGVVFNLAENTSLTANIEPVAELEINIIGQTINIRKNTGIQEITYPLIITPILSLTLEGEGGNVTYIAEVNKKLNETVVNYKFGATSINNKNYNTVPIQTSKSVNDEITILSTDIDELAPLYYIVGLNGQTMQGNSSELTYQLETGNFLFNVQFTKLNNDTEGSGELYKHIYGLNISVNTNSSIYTDRYNKEIYGKYLLYIQPQSNSSLSILMEIEFERTVVNSVIIDNYKSLDEMEGSSLTSTSEFAYPGESGLLQITVTPEDSDFDYVLIENDDQNYQPGRASSTFSLLSRNVNSTGGSGLFASGTILGSLTSKGVKFTQDEIIRAYSPAEYVSYNGVIYIKYSMSSKNVTDLSSSKINVTFYKDTESYPAFKTLKVKLKNFVAIEIEGKEGLENQNGYYMSYNVARGMTYKLNINSFGFKQENIEIKSSNPSLGKVTKENGKYYLTVTEGVIDYAENANFDLVIEAKQNEGENVRQAESKTKISVFEYVINYNHEANRNADIVSGAGKGVVNVQVGSQINLKLDLYDFVEYNASIPSVVNSIEKFFNELTEQGSWYALTNLISDDQPDYASAPVHNLENINNDYIKESERKIYKLNTQEIKNYYFKNQNLNLMPIRTHIPEERFYYLGYIGRFIEENGIYVYTSNPAEISAKIVKTTFALNVYTTSSEESPIPIYDYDDLCNMQEGGYYILLNDITLPSITDESIGVNAFKPLTGDFASFDGNGHSINFAGTYDMGSLSEIGLFSYLEENSVVKNLIVNYVSSGEGSDLNTNPNDTTYGLYGLQTVKFITTSDSFLFGSIVAENYGIITNCQVYTEKTDISEYYLTVKADNALTGSSYMGGIAGRNSGFITNCGASINVKTPFNIGGIVAQNSNKIAGCYFSEGKLINNSQFAQYVGGFAVSNAKDAVIMTSYVAGEQNPSNLYSEDSNSYITSTIIGAGFIYENLGKINDCYTNIDLSKTTAEMSGFVYKNAGIIKNSFSLSVLRNNTTASSGFVKEDSILGESGTFDNCYYYYHKKVAGDSEDNVNTSIYDTTFDGVKALTREQFANYEEYFKEYSYEDGMDAKSVWFIAKGNTSSNYVEYTPTTQKITIEGENGQYQSNTVYKQEIINFGMNRLELVSPNVRVLSIRNFAYSEMDETTGNITYFYNDDISTPVRGSIHNPRLIYSPESMEREVLNETASTNINITNYRLISDIRYDEYEGHSGLYKVKFAGILEGNGMRISGISLVSMEELENAGLFAQIGYSQSKQGSVKNLTISPKVVSFNSADSVGTLAGMIKYGSVYDVKIEAVEGSSETITGFKFVGGVFGKAVSSFVIKDVYSSANVSANYSPSLDKPYIENDNIAGGDYSYAGSIAGYVGNGKLYNAHVSNVKSVMGGRAGFAYGGIGKGSDVRYTFVDVLPASTIKAYQYGGYISGEVGGNLAYSYVSDNGNVESTFSNVPKVATAVGGITGRFNGGNISNALMEQDFRCNATENNQTIMCVGGIVGIISAVDSTISNINDSIVNADISAGAVLGGGIGRITSAAYIQGLAIKSAKLAISGQRANPCLGGVVGSIYNTGSLDLLNSYCNALLEIKTSTSGTQSTAYAGGLIADAKNAPRIYYCYTTSTINAEVYDLRQVSGIVDFKEIKNQNYSEQVSYEQKVYSDKNVSNTYYWGINTSGEEKYIDGVTINEGVYNSNFVSFKTKAKSVPMKLFVSNFGEATNNINKSLLNNVFGKNYQLTRTVLGSVVTNLIKTTNGFNYTIDGKEYLYIKDGANAVYYYQNLVAETDDTKLFTVGTADIKTYYMYDGKKYEFKIKYIDDRVSARYLQQVGSSSELVWNGSTFGDEIGVADLYKRLEFSEKDLKLNAVYKGSDGIYYLKNLQNNGTSVYKNIITDIKATNDISFEEQPVWAEDVYSFSALNIEKEFDWLNMS